MTKMQKHMRLAKYAELCWASYSEGLNEGMYGNEERKFGNKNSEVFKELANKNKELPTYHQALSESKFLIFEKYNVNFSDSQADNFIKRFEVLAFSQDDDTSFSATLFYDTKDSEFILAIRGIDIFRANWNFVNAIKSSVKIIRGKVSINYYLSMLKFYDSKLKHIIQDRKITITGHSFGGYLAQLFALSFPQHTNCVYTFNAVGITPNKIANYIDTASEIANTVAKQIAFDFSVYDSDIDEFKSITITDKIKNAVGLDSGLLVCDDKAIKHKIPKYLQKDFITTQQNSYRFNTAEIGARMLYNEIQKAPIGHNVFAKVRLDGFLPHTIDTEIFTLNPHLSIAVKNLISYLPNSHKELPLPLRQSEVYRIYTIDILDTETLLTQFGNHLYPTETILIKLNVMKPQGKFEDLRMGKLAKLVFKGAKMGHISIWTILLVSIDSIYKEIVAQSRIKNDDIPINCYWCGWESLF